MTDTHLRPRSFSELIDATFHLLRARFRAVATVGALSRSNQLTKGLWKHSVGVSALAFLIAVVPYLGATLLAGEFGSRIVQQIVGMVMSVILTPIYVASLVALYYDLRIRKEGFDLELMASELATAVPDAGPDLPIVRGA